MRSAKERREALERAKGRLQTEGVEAAVEALIAVCRDEQAPANAKSTAGSALLRANGLFDKGTTAPDKEIHEMSLDELREYTARIEQDRDAMLSEMEEGEETAFD
ncbi:hypothetical protein [Mesorhizobium sp. SP-1A]|uniref:hypothetical protein n=1 Tax=Mesorhizobium sp. SP-1A TaxID=3077840 RepID=UPI0028F6D3D3|nr:hypothetical protein [Mesorhizobium sp. SP-1A]